MKFFFQKVYDMLEENGIFILEPQMWPSYKKKAKISEVISQLSYIRLPKKIIKTSPFDPNNLKTT